MRSTRTSWGPSHGRAFIPEITLRSFFQNYVFVLVKESCRHLRAVALAFNMPTFTNVYVLIKFKMVSHHRLGRITKQIADTGANNVEV